MKVFSNFSFEPTFKLNEIPEEYDNLTEEELIDWYQGMHQSYNLITIRPGNPFYGNPVQDSCSLEVPTGKYCKKDYKKFKKEYKEFLIDVFAKKNIIESSNVDMNSEGGCHINIDLEYKYNNETKAKFVLSLRNYILNNPSIVWMFLSPNDNVSSKIGGKFLLEYSEYYKWSKGDAVNVKYNFNYSYYSRYDQYVIKYVEFRFFMMPRNDYEFDTHFEFANKLMFHIHKNKNIPCIYNDGNEDAHGEYIDKLKKYTYKQAIKEFKKVCEEIDFDYQKIIDCGKEKLLKERFSYGKEWLV